MWISSENYSKRVGILKKKRMASQISNGTIDAMYEAACRGGSARWENYGSRGRGLSNFFCLPDRREAVREALKISTSFLSNWNRMAAK